MASYSVVLDSRLRKDGSAQVRFTVRQARRQKWFATGVYLEPSQWDSVLGAVRKSHPLYRQINIKLSRMRSDLDEALLRLPLLASAEAVFIAAEAALFPDAGETSGAVPSGREAAAYGVSGGCGSGRVGSASGGAARNGSGGGSGRGAAVPLLVEVVRRFAALKGEASTRATYLRTLRHLERFRAEATLEEVNKSWLAEFDACMSESAKSPNARAIHMRNLRAVFNFALDEGLTANYPFRKYRIRTAATPKRSLTAEQLRTLLTMEVEEWQRPYRDFFALSFFLIGTNAKDILFLPPGADSSGRVEFNRAKTRKLYSIRVEPEARMIIDRYRGRGHMLDVMDSRTDYVQYIRQVNHGLKLLGTECAAGKKGAGSPLFPGISTYWARHSWATIAAELDVPKETIAAALGHDMGNLTTAIYIDFNRRKIDEANRRVIDYVLYNIR